MNEIFYMGYATEMRRRNNRNLPVWKRYEPKEYAEILKHRHNDPGRIASNRYDTARTEEAALFYQRVESFC